MFIDGRTDGWMNRPSNRDVRMHLKRGHTLDFLLFLCTFELFPDIFKSLWVILSNSKSFFNWFLDSVGSLSPLLSNLYLFS